MPRNDPYPTDGRDASIRGFCARKGISVPTFYNLRRRGLAPDLTYVTPSLIIITPKAEAKWDREREKPSAAERAAIAAAAAVRKEKASRAGYASAASRRAAMARRERRQRRASS